MIPNYNTNNLLIEYHNNAEYRNVLRRVFNMEVDSINIAYQYETIDHETLDELTYDEDKVMEEMKNIYEITENNILFQELYDLSAAKMISLDRTIGICILFSYDYFYLFHACLCVFLKSPLDFTELCKYYIQLKMELEKR
jgi:hypothetical protein